MIKTIEAYDSETFDAKVNEFCKQNNVFATQTSVSRVEGLPTLYIATVFFRTKDDYNRS